ncbi:hypothetical protein [Bradyrhizobium sp.]|jgi:hypothetical protein|uniref:hypothetical protein n=1 Tax=Bradyrhizobium sp. TaxID=376 RepID=UPI002DF8C3B4|nr:hypothetical protein [Bradyrhizobium sp.]
MLQFNLTSSPNLFAATVNGMWVAYCWPATPEPPTQPISFGQALSGPGTFLFCSTPRQDINEVASDIVTAVTGAWNAPDYNGTSHAISWLTDPDNIIAANVALLGINTLNAKNMYVNAGKLQQIVPNNLSLNIASGVALSSSGDDTLTLTNTQNNLNFYGPAAPGARIVSATLAFSGPAPGTIQFTTAIKRGEMYGRLRWGCQLLYDTGASAKPIRSQWYPLADGSRPNGADMLGFAVSIDPSDPTNARAKDRSYFAFTDPAAILISGFRTAFGDIINLRPITQPQSGEQAARLIVTIGNPNAPSQPDYSLSPEGDFILMLAAPKDGISSHMLCGLTATETLSFTAGPAANPQSGDRLRFTANSEAFATSYPPPQSSPVGPPVDPKAPKMNASYRTAWATVIPAPNGNASQYSAQPKGSPLFGFDKVVAPASPKQLGFVDPGYALTRPDPFPMMPFGLAPLGEFGVSFTQSELGGIEQFAAAATRRALIGAPGMSQPRRALRMSEAVGDSSDWVTTPSGLLAELDQTAGHWSSVLLGVNNGAGPMWMVFNDPPPKLQQALQTANLFLVAANAANLGTLSPQPAVGPAPPAPTGTATFYNTMSIQDWQITANVGQSNVYNDYNNILIIKGCKGKLVDLVAKPDIWTQREDFSVPGTDLSETVILSQWIADHIQKAQGQTSPYFDNFKSIVADDNWTGILVLKASLTGLPTNLAGLLSVIDPSQCFAHHFGITITPVGISGAQTSNPTISTTNSSSIFQLVYYVDPAFDQANPVPLPPSNAPYDFKLLTLEALFKNTAVKSFDSYAQLTLGAFFGDSVNHMGDTSNVYDTIMLKGSYQQNGGVGTFMLDCVDDSLFFLNSAAINKVEITKAQFNTIGPTSLQFALWGFIDFNLLSAVDPSTQEQDVPFDLFSFGSIDSPSAPRAGLSFAGLTIDLNTGVTPWVFGFDVAAVTFDASRSTPRKGSLYTDFALSLKGLLSGDDSSTANPQSDPSSLNYLNVPTNAPLSGVGGSPWYALQFGVDLGSVGALASNAGLNASMIAAWAPSSQSPPVPGSQLTTFNAMAGLQLPGVTAKSKLLSLEGVLALSIGDIRLTYAAPDDKTTTRYWVLWLSDIALKFLGLLKIPPNGAISFACFGNPDANGVPSALGWYAVYNQDKKKDGNSQLAAAGNKTNAHQSDAG